MSLCITKIRCGDSDDRSGSALVAQAIYLFIYIFLTTIFNIISVIYRLAIYPETLALDSHPPQKITI